METVEKFYLWIKDESRCFILGRRGSIFSSITHKVSTLVIYFRFNRIVLKLFLLIRSRSNIKFSLSASVIYRRDLRSVNLNLQSARALHPSSRKPSTVSLTIKRSALSRQSVKHERTARTAE